MQPGKLDSTKGRQNSSKTWQSEIHPICEMPWASCSAENSKAASVAHVMRNDGFGELLCLTRHWAEIAKDLFGGSVKIECARHDR